MTRLDDFVKHVAKSGLVVAAELERARARLPAADGRDADVRLARLLVGEGTLTGYQAGKLLAGVTRGFFLGGYRILRRLGHSGMGKVYLAVHEQGGQKVAIKVLPPRKAAEEKESLARFRREMELSQRLQHRNVARTIEVGTEGAVHFMVMEYIAGDSLYNLVKSEHGGAWRVADTARYFVRVLDGLAAAHDAGLVHRDLKPSNLMVTPEGDAKILDLGLARALGEDKPGPRRNVVVGTLDYASPEQIGDASRANARSDLYSIGCTLYFTLAGRAPFEGGDAVNKIFKQQIEDPEPLERVARGVPAAFAAIVRRLMAKDPAARYASARELQADLSRWTNPERVRALVGAGAESGHPFHPPPAEEESVDDLETASVDDGPFSDLAALDDADDVEASRSALPPSAYPRRSGNGEARWLVPFIVAVCVVGVLVAVIIAMAT